tara:strand:- start:171 stop:356 length:186 start_codon:yes stop_codon:yes gene_type:complete
MGINMSYKESDWKIRGYEGGGFSHDEYMEMESWEMNDFHEGTIKRLVEENIELKKKIEELI